MTVVGVAIVVSVAGLGTVGWPVVSQASPKRALSTCRAPRLTGLTIVAARRLAAKAGCHLRLEGARVTQAVIQTVAKQQPRDGEVTRDVTVWVNPVCWMSALPGPPAGEPIVRAGPTRVVSGLFLVGGPEVIFSSPRCAAHPESPWAGTITISDRSTGAIVAIKHVAKGHLARFDVTPGAYTINGTFAQARVNEARIHATPRAVDVAADETVRQDVIADVP